MTRVWDRFVWWLDHKLGAYADKRGMYQARRVREEREKRRNTRK